MRGSFQFLSDEVGEDNAGQECGDGCCKAAGHAVTVKAEHEVEHSDVTDEAEYFEVQQLVERDEQADEDGQAVDDGFERTMDEGESVHDNSIHVHFSNVAVCTYMLFLVFSCKLIWAPTLLFVLKFLAGRLFLFRVQFPEILFFYDKRVGLFRTR